MAAVEKLQPNKVKRTSSFEGWNYLFNSEGGVRLNYLFNSEGGVRLKELKFCLILKEGFV